jgi:hypothetical protein
MKVCISDFSVIALEAPALPAYEAIIGGATRWIIWCKHCAEWHWHGPAEGHREAHCQDSSSPYWKSGYNLAYAGKWRKDGRKRS